MNITILSERRYGHPKLLKPEELKGVKQSGSAMFGPRCKCPVFITDNSVYVKHRDWFSESVPIPTAVGSGIIGKKKNKFLYNDNFGSVVLRNEAWLRIDGDLSGFAPQTVDKLIRATEEAARLSEYDLQCYEWVKFYEDVVSITTL